MNYSNCLTDSRTWDNGCMINAIAVLLPQGYHYLWLYSKRYSTRTATYIISSWESRIKFSRYCICTAGSDPIGWPLAVGDAPLLLTLLAGAGEGERDLLVVPTGGGGELVRSIGDSVGGVWSWGDTLSLRGGWEINSWGADLLLLSVSADEEATPTDDYVK